jgi:hypothetical protein
MRTVCQEQRLPTILPAGFPQIVDAPGVGIAIVTVVFPTLAEAIRAKRAAEVRV